MACYLSIEHATAGLECFGCTLSVANKPLVPWTDELQPGKLVPVCLRCLRGLDPPLARFHDLVGDLAIAARVIAEVAGDLRDDEEADPAPPSAAEREP